MRVRCRQFQKSVLLKKSNKYLITFILTLGLFIFWIFQYRKFKMDSQPNKKDLCELPPIKLLSRAFYISGGKSSSSPTGIEFEDEKYKNFRIEGSEYLSLKNVSKLFDTLQYSATKIKIYTDDQGCRDYFDENSMVDIRVLALRIGNEDFIEKYSVAKVDRRLTKESLIIAPIFYISILLLIFFSKKRSK